MVPTDWMEYMQTIEDFLRPQKRAHLALKDMDKGVYVDNEALLSQA